MEPVLDQTSTSMRVEYPNLRRRAIYGLFWGGIFGALPNLLPGRLIQLIPYSIDSIWRLPGHLTDVVLSGFECNPFHKSTWLIGNTFFWAGLASGLCMALTMLRKKRICIDQCPMCSYWLRGNVSGICPECGHPIDNRKDTTNTRTRRS